MSTPMPPPRPAPGGEEPQRMPRWVPRAIAAFWFGLVVIVTLRWAVGRLAGFLLLLLVSLFLALAIEPAVNRLERRGWRRGRATLLVMLILVVAIVLFLTAIGTLVGGQIADLLQNSEDYVNRIVDFANNLLGTKLDPAEINAEIADPNGRFQRFIASQSGDALRLSFAALGGLLQAFSALLFTFYLVADGARLRRAICRRLPPERQARVLRTWELAIDKTGGYLYSRALLAGLSAVFHWLAFTMIGVPAPVALALWVGIISQFVPVIGTYIAGLLPIVLILVNPGTNPIRALVVAGFIAVYQQIENYVFAPRITARTMELHAAVAFGAALAGAALIGPIGAVLALPFVAMMQAVLSEYGSFHEVIDSPLVRDSRQARSAGRRRASGRRDEDSEEDEP
ncbi:MAG: AI-2E family transporter [Ilumatobacteraceae bacterium]